MLHSTRYGTWGLTLLLFLLPFWLQAQTITTNTYATTAISTPAGTAVTRTFRVSGSNLTQNITVAVHSNQGVFKLRVAPNDGSTISGDFVQSTTIPLINGNVTDYRVQVQFLSSTAGNFTDYIDISSGAVQPIDDDGNPYAVQVTATATPVGPTLQVTSSLNTFGDVAVGSNSAIQSFSVDGSNLTGAVTVTPPTGFQIRRVGATNFTQSSITLTPVNGTLATTSIEVRFSPVTEGVQSSAITVQTLNSSSTITRSVAVSGTGTVAPAVARITATPTVIDFGTVTNSGSATTKTFTIDATRLMSSITVKPSSNNIEIRNLTANGSFTTAQLIVASDANGVVSNVVIEARLVQIVPKGAFNGSVALTATGDDGTGNSAPVSSSVSITAQNPSGTTSNISITQGDLRAFDTSAGIASETQSYFVSGTNLLQDITITAPQYFQIALSASDLAALGTNTGNVLTLQRDPSTGNVASTQIFVRYYPPAAQENSGQFINHVSSPALTQFVSISGSSLPTVTIQNVFTTVEKQLVNTKSGIQQLNIRGVRVSAPITITVPKEAPNAELNPQGTEQFEISLTGNEGDFYRSRTVSLSDGQTLPLFIRYAPTRVGQAVVNLTFTSSDFVTPSNSAGVITPTNGRLEGRSIATEPLQQSNATVIRSEDGKSATILFNKFPANQSPTAAGYGENRIIIASATHRELRDPDYPVDAISYNPNNGVYGGSGPLTEITPGNYVVFTGSATTVTVTGLDPNVATYYFFGFEYNNSQVAGAENYKTPNNSVTNPLPVELVAFSAKLHKSRVYVTWTTASEKNNEGFNVERSQDGKTFVSVAYQKGQGTTANKTSYEAVDSQPLVGTSYYRLKQTDYDGIITYSPVVTIINTIGSLSVSVYPNPTQDVVTINLGQLAAEGIQVQLTDLMGRTVRTQQLGVTGELDMRDVKPGTYFIMVHVGEQKYVSKVVKN